MAKIPLRVYVKEIENLIERGEIEQAVSHARNILKSYPKHIETYRLLGKAYLESQRYSEASDIMQRVLSVIPDDFVSQIGMSIIREDEGNLDAAIWHMERAYEIQPFNPAVQDELRRLYGRRDGVEPPKIRLTRGALVRMYARGELYPQAIAETRAALAEDPQRLDLQVLLARLYYLSGQKIEATEISSSLLSKLPYCLEANQILTDVLPGTNRAEDAPKFQQRLNALDPYAAYLSPSALTVASVPDQTVQVEQFIWDASMQEGQAPDWARNIGVQWEAPAEEALPDWLSSLKPESTDQTQTIPSAELSTEEQTGGHTAPLNQIGSLQQRSVVEDMPPISDQQGATENKPSLEPAAESSDELIPDWMKDAGWVPSDRTADEIMAGLPEENPEEITPAQIPDWLQSIAPPDAGEVKKEEEDQTNWLDNLLEKQGDNGNDFAGAAPITLEGGSAVESSALPAWLSDLESTTDEEADFRFTEPARAEIEGEPENLASFGEGELPDWLTTENEQPAAVEGGIDPAAPDSPTEELGQFVDWTPADTLSTTPQEPSAAESDDWLSAMEKEPGQDASVTDESTSWMEGIAAQEAEEAAQPAADIPDWLQSLEPGAAEITEPAQDWMQPGEPEAVTGVETSSVEQIPAEPAVGIPDWLQSLDPESQVKAQESQIDSTFDQLAPPQAELQAEPGTAEQEPSAASSATEMPDFSDMDAAMAWLEGLAAKQGADEATLLISKPEDRPEETPEWIRKQSGEVPSLEGQPEEEQPPARIEEPAVEAEQLEWPQPAAEQAVGEQPAVPPEAELAGSIEQPADRTPEDITAVETQAGESAPTAESEAPDFSDLDQAMAWLEALAAKQGADEATLLITRPEDRSEEPPEWVRKQTGELPALDLAEQPAEAQAEAETQPSSEGAVSPFEIPEWLQQEEETATAGWTADEQLPAAAAEIPTVEEQVAEVGEQLPAAETPQAQGAPDFSDMDAAMAWLESLAAKQGADEDTLLITPPESRTETPPEWIQKQMESEPAGEVSIQQEAVLPTEDVTGAPSAAESPQETVFGEPSTTEAPISTGQPTPMAERDEMDEALAWLEALAARQGADEATLLISTPEQRSEEMPDWVRKQTGSLELPEEEQLEAPPEVDLQQMPAVETLAAEELDEAELPTPWSEVSGVVSDKQDQVRSEEQQTTGELPAWLAEESLQRTDEAEEPMPAADQEAEWAPEFGPTDESVAAPTRSDPLPDWLQEKPEAEQEPDYSGREEAEVPDWLARLEEEESRSAWAPEAQVVQPTPEVTRTSAPGGYSLDILQTALMRGDLDTALAGYGRLIQNGEKLEETIHDLRDALYRYPVDISIWQSLGDAYARNNQLQEALDAYTKAEELLR